MTRDELHEPSFRVRYSCVPRGAESPASHQEDTLTERHRGFRTKIRLPHQTLHPSDNRNQANGRQVSSD
jgi:hypothetical protein